ncbi:hypothetical protein M569_16207, partial [Genlisea aurea]
LFAFVVLWSGYRSFFPPAPRVCGSPGGPAADAPRIKLRDGRYLAYKEHGVPKQTAKYKIIFLHGFGSSRLEVRLSSSKLVEKLGIYFVSFDRPGYGQSDPDPNRTIRSTALDVEELGDQLGLGERFYLIGYSMGGNAVWGCLKYIPHRLAGAALIAPVVNYWWPGFPPKLASEAYGQQFRRDQWALRVAHHFPWLVYWWNTQKLFPASSVVSGKPNFTPPDLRVLLSRPADDPAPANKEYATQQGVHESIHRDMMVGFGKWDFDPMDLDDPFRGGKNGSVHLWSGDQDGLVPFILQRYIARKLPWLRFHHVPNAAHLLIQSEPTIKDEILSTLL